MTELHEINVSLSERQKTNLCKAFLNRETITLRLSKDDLNGSNTLYVPATILNRLLKNREMNKEMNIKLFGGNIRRQVCGSIVASMPLYCQ